MDINELYIPGVYRAEIQGLKSKLKELDALKISISGPHLDRVGSSRSVRPGAHFENTIEQYDKVYSEFIDVFIRYINAKDRLCKEIDRLENERYKDVLVARYITGGTAQEIADMLGVDIRYYYRLQKKAKQAFERLEDEG